MRVSNKNETANHSREAKKGVFPIMTITTSNRLSRVMLCAGSILGMTAYAAPAFAQNNDAEEIAIAAQPLSDALLEISERYDSSIIVSDDLVRGRKATAIAGNLTVRQALRAALRGTGLTVESSPGGAFVIVELAIAEGNQIVVTGQQIDRTLQETKESVSVFTEKEIESRSLLEIDDVLLQTANVTFSDPGTSNIAIRGVSRIPFTTGGSGDTSTTFYDDVAITNQAIAFLSQNLWDVQQLELLRGPQSTNLGRNALIGALVIRTNDPKLDEYEAAVRAEIGNFGTHNLEAMVNVPITSNTALRITGERTRTDGFIDNVTLGTDDDARRNFTTVRAKLRTEFADRFNATVSLQYVDGDVSNASYIAPIDGPFNSFESTANIAQTNPFEGFTGSLNLQYEVSDFWAIQSITAFSDADSDRLFDGDGTEIDGGFSMFPSSQSNISQELRLSYEGDNLRGVIGGYYLDDRVDSAFIVSGRINPALVGVPAPLLPFYPELLAFNQNTGSDVERTNFALFTQWEYQVAERLTISAGLRYDRESFEAVTNGQTDLDPSTPLPDPAASGALAEMQQPGSGAFVEGGVAAVNGALLAQLTSFTESRETTFDAFLPEFGLSYEFSPDIQASLFYKRGYRAGGAQLEASGALNEFDPEFLDNFEFSIRSSFLNNTLTLNANAYYAFWTDQQVNVPIDGNQFNLRTENSGESRIWGFELEANYEPTDKTLLFANIGYANTEFREFCSISSTVQGLPDCEVDGVAGKDLSGNEFGVSPNWTAAFGGQQFLTDSFYLQANATYQSGSFGDAENRPVLRAESFFLVNASFGYQGDTFDVRLYARNLLDEFYDIKRFNGQLPNQVGIIPGAPREYGIIVGARF